MSLGDVDCPCCGVHPTQSGYMQEIPLLEKNTQTLLNNSEVSATLVFSLPEYHPSLTRTHQLQVFLSLLIYLLLKKTASPYPGVSGFFKSPIVNLRFLCTQWCLLMPGPIFSSGFTVNFCLGDHFPLNIKRSAKAKLYC